MPETSTPIAEPAVRLEHVELTADQVLADYRWAYRSRQVSLVGRREVMSGKAKFGIFGDGKEVAQVAMVHAVRPGDHRSGYYRDQTLMFATGALEISAYFAQLYADADVGREPATAGRTMGAHFGTRLLDERGRWLNQLEGFNSSTDVSPTGSQMPRLVGLTYASRLYRELDELRPHAAGFSDNGSEVVWGTIGNATCAEGMFWEAVNAVGVLGGPMVLSIWDDVYGISVPNEYQVTKQDLTALLSGFGREPGKTGGYDLYTVRGWDYPALVDAYARAARMAREEHVPALLHVIELTQPQGHSTSGSHERYKSAERLAWEEEYDCVRRMRLWILEQGIAREAELESIEEEERRYVEGVREGAWEAFQAPLRAERDELLEILEEVATAAAPGIDVSSIADRLAERAPLLRRHLHEAAREALIALRGGEVPEAEVLKVWRARSLEENRERYGSELHAEGEGSALAVEAVPPEYAPDAPELNGFEIMNACFDALLARDPRVIAFGEDVGAIGDVNQGFRGMQEKYGPLRVSDTGIREVTIVGQAIGMAMRGLRPIAEIQYLDYLLYALQLMSDDLATLRWRSAGGQKAPVIVRTRGHRLEGVWHSGSPMAGIINLLRGMHVLVPRDMTRAAGMYNTLHASDEPGLIIEVLNGYRLKERLPANIADMRVPLGVVDVLREGSDITLVTYGATCRIVMEAADVLSALGAEAEVIDVQTLLPFDLEGRIARSVEKTGRVVFIDEDVPGGGTAYMLQAVVEQQGGFWQLDSPPRTLPGTQHRPAYGTDGDYFSKPNVETVVDTVLEVLNEAEPDRFPLLSA